MSRMTILQKKRQHHTHAVQQQVVPEQMKTKPLDWQSFEKQLRKYIKKRVPKNAVDDIYGDVILRLVSNQDKFQSAANPVAWMYKVTTNIITDYYRNHVQEQAVNSQSATDNTEEPANVDKDTLPSDELAKCVLPLIKNLPTAYSEALLMTEIKGMKQADAAKKLNLSLSGMKSRVQRGRSLLKKAILGCCQISVNRKGNIIDYEQSKSCC